MDYERMGVVHVNVRMLYTIFSSLKSRVMCILLYMIMNSVPTKQVFIGNVKEIAKNNTCSPRTVNRALKILIEKGVLSPNGVNNWKINIAFLPDEEYEQLTESPPHSCFMFLEERDEDDVDSYDEEETFETKFKRLKAEWDAIKEQ